MEIEAKLERDELLRRDELALVGSCLMDPSVIPMVAEITTQGDFLDDTLGKAFAAIVLAHDAGLPVHNYRVMQRELIRQGVAEHHTSDDGLGRLYKSTPHAGHARYYAEVVRDAAALRRLAATGKQLIERSEDFDAKPAKLAEWATAQLAMQAPSDAAQVVTAGEVALQIVADLRAPKDRSRPLMTGLYPLDDFAGGWHPGELIILAARPSIGKTALGLQVAQHTAEQGKPALVVSLEMRDRELVSRQLAGIGGVDGRRLRSGATLREDELAALDGATAKLDSVPLKIWAPPSATMSRIRGIAKHTAATSGLALLVVDYLGLVRPADHYRPRHEQIAEVSAGLKGLAKELDVPVLALCQLNREAEKENAPLLSHLRDSGAIEQDADVVLLLHRADRQATEASIFVAKHRHGATGLVKVEFDPEATRFDAPNYEWSPPRG